MSSNVVNNKWFLDANQLTTSNLQTKFVKIIYEKQMHRAFIGNNGSEISCVINQTASQTHKSDHRNNVFSEKIAFLSNIEMPTCSGIYIYKLIYNVLNPKDNNPAPVRIGVINSFSNEQDFINDKNLSCNYFEIGTEYIRAPNTTLYVSTLQNKTLLRQYLNIQEDGDQLHFIVNTYENSMQLKIYNKNNILMNKDELKLSLRFVKSKFYVQIIPRFDKSKKDAQILYDRANKQSAQVNNNNDLSKILGLFGNKNKKKSAQSNNKNVKNLGMFGGGGGGTSRAVRVAAASEQKATKQLEQTKDRIASLRIYEAIIQRKHDMKQEIGSNDNICCFEEYKSFYNKQNTAKITENNKLIVSNLVSGSDTIYCILKPKLKLNCGTHTFKIQFIKEFVVNKSSGLNMYMEFGIQNVRNINKLLTKSHTDNKHEFCFWSLPKLLHQINIHQSGKSVKNIPIKLDMKKPQLMANDIIEITINTDSKCMFFNLLRNNVSILNECDKLVINNVNFPIFKVYLAFEYSNIYAGFRIIDYKNTNNKQVKQPAIQQNIFEMFDSFEFDNDSKSNNDKTDNKCRVLLCSNNCLEMDEIEKIVLLQNVNVFIFKDDNINVLLNEIKRFKPNIIVTKSTYIETEHIVCNDSLHMICITNKNRNKKQLKSMVDMNAANNNLVYVLCNLVPVNVLIHHFITTGCIKKQYILNKLKTTHGVRFQICH